MARIKSTNQRHAYDTEADRLELAERFRDKLGGDEFWDASDRWSDFVRNVLGVNDALGDILDQAWTEGHQPIVSDSFPDIPITEPPVRLDIMYRAGRAYLVERSVETGRFVRWLRRFA